MKTIRNPVKWMAYRAELIELRNKAIKEHRPRSHLDRELQMVTTALIDWALRDERKRAA